MANSNKRTEISGAADLNLTPRDETRLAAALGSRTDEASFLERLKVVRDLATREWVDWILGVRRYESISSLERDRLLAIFGQVRREAPTTEALVEQFAISESRSTSLLSRMRFGAARLIRGLRYAAAKKELEAQLPSGHTESGGTTVWVTSDTGRLIDEANSAIMVDQAGRLKGGKWEGAVKANRVETARTGQAWEATDTMWKYIIRWLDEQGRSLSSEGSGD